MGKILSIFCGVLILFSCGEKEKKSMDSEQLDYLVTDYFAINDSILPEKYIEYFAYVKINPKIINWKKIYFEREVNSLNSKGIFYLQDSIFIKYSLNKDFTVRKIENWSVLFKKVKSFYFSYIENSNIDKAENLKNFENVFLDSTLIAQKNTKDIELFNQALHYIKNENTFKKMGFKENMEFGIITLKKRKYLEGEEILNSFSLFSDLAKIGTQDKIKKAYFDIIYEIYPKTNSILSAELEITIINSKLDTLKNNLKMELNKI